MMLDPQHLSVINNEAANRFEVTLEHGQMAIMAYMLAKGRIMFTHTEVPAECEGNGIARWRKWRLMRPATRVYK